MHPEDSDFYGDSEPFDFGLQQQGPTSTNEEKENEHLLHTPPQIREEDLPPKVPRNPAKTRSPPKTTSRAPTVRYDILVSFRRPKERLTNKAPDTCVAQYTLNRAPNAYRQPEFYKGLATRARTNLLLTPPYSAWSQLQGPFIPKFDFASPMFKYALADKTCHTFKTYPKEEDTVVAPEPGVFLRNERPDTEHVRFYVTFDCNISQKTILRAIKEEKVVETLDSGVQEEYPTPVMNLLQAADRAAYILSSNPQQAAAEWMAAFPIYTKELTEWSPTALKFQQVQPQICGPELTADNPATLPRNSTSEVPFIATNFGQPKIRKNLQVTINTKGGGRDIVATPDTTGTPQPGPQEDPQDLTIKPVDTSMLMAPIPQEENPNIKGLLLQILNNQQQMVPRPSAYHRLGPRTPPLQKTDQPKKSKRAIKRDLYFQRKSALHRSRSSSTRSDSGRRNQSRHRSPSPKRSKEERQTSRHRSKSPRSRSTRRQDHSKDRSVSPKRPRDDLRTHHRREEDRRSPPRPRHPEDRPRPKSRPSRSPDKPARPQRETDHIRKSMPDEEKAKPNEQISYAEYGRLLGVPAHKVREVFRRANREHHH